MTNSTWERLTDDMEGFHKHHRPAGRSNRNGTARLARRLAGGAGAVLAFVALSGGTASAGGQEPLSDRDGAPVFLSEVVRTALERNRDVLDAEYQLAVAGEQVSEAWSEVYPNVNLSTSFTRNVAPQVSFLPAQIFDPSASEGDFIPVQFGADNIWNLSVNAEQTLFDPRIFVGVGAASRFEGLQREAVRGRTQQVVTRVRLAFYDVLLGQEEVRLTENSLRRVRESLRETTAMREAGMTSDYEVLRLEVELDMSDLPRINTFLTGLAFRARWSAASIERLTAAGEETLSTMLQLREDYEDQAKPRLIVTAQGSPRVIDLEFMAIFGEGNIEDHLAYLVEHTDTPDARDVSFRLLRHYASSVRHSKYYGIDIVGVQVESLPES